MNFIEQDSRNSIPSSGIDGTGNANYFAFFDRPIPENLSANRRGILTLQQQKALEEIVASQRAALVAFGGMSVFGALFMCFLFWKIDVADGIVSFPAQLINGVVVILVFVAFVGFSIGDLFVFFAGDDLTNGVVESAVGKIEWSGKRYRMRTESRLLRSLRSRVALPPPGGYRFYYLPRTGLVVMAEEAGNDGAHHVPTLLLALASANSFSPEDLKVNQQGMLSKRQENGLLLILALYVVSCMSIAALFTILIPLILRAVPATWALLVFIIGTILLLNFGWSAIKLIADVWHGKPSSVEDRVVRQTRRTRYYRFYYYVSGSHKFQVSESAYNALIEGKPYRIFYVPRSKRLVSMEPIGASTVMDGMN